MLRHRCVYPCGDTVVKDGLGAAAVSSSGRDVTPNEPPPPTASFPALATGSATDALA
ncbi:UNVERIFIED_CONTAM: hypothetical protein Sradi_0958000 [Sesamum radiatum]|uniref:Uncharacterized protein n=1 Tax=Sesamum radiatum TaxID=300843 RepID=A0AAW2V704_SESRA